MPPKSRNRENKSLPRRWRVKHGAYYYRVPTGLESQWDGKKEFRLGKTLVEAYESWTARLSGERGGIATMSQLMDQYLREVVPGKAPKTQEGNRVSIEHLRVPFGEMHPDDVLPRHYNQYKHKALSNYGKVTVNHDLEVLSHLLTMCVEWGVIDRNPLLGQVKKHPTKPRNRLVEDWEIVAALKVAHPLIKLYIPFKLATGLRRTDILQMKTDQLMEDGIHIQPSKTRHSTGKRLIIEWDEDGEMRALVEHILMLPPRRVGNVHLFVTRQGHPYIKGDGSANAFDSLWQRFMAKVMNQTDVVERFQERDLRAKSASESDTLEQASERLGHSTTDITRRVYRRKPSRVQPLLKSAWKVEDI